MKKFLILLLTFTLTLPVYAKNTILIIGDSVSAAYGMDLEQSWVKLLEKRLKENNKNYTVINASVSGDTSSNGLQRAPKALAQHQPKITIIELGANDGLRGVPLTTIKNNLEKLIQLAQSAGSKVLVLGIRLPPNYGLSYTQQFHELFSNLPTSNNVKVIPFFLNRVDSNTSLMQADRIHPNAKAQSILLNTVWVDLEGWL